jgi:hypothetical protein
VQLVFGHARDMAFPLLRIQSLLSHYTSQILSRHAATLSPEQRIKLGLQMGFLVNVTSWPTYQPYDVSFETGKIGDSHCVLQLLFSDLTAAMLWFGGIRADIRYSFLASLSLVLHAGPFMPCRLWADSCVPADDTLSLHVPAFQGA